MLTAIVKELATVLQADITIILANETLATVEMVCVATGDAVVTIHSNCRLMKWRMFYQLINCHWRSSLTFAVNKVMNYNRKS